MNGGMIKGTWHWRCKVCNGPLPTDLDSDICSKTCWEKLGTKEDRSLWESGWAAEDK